mmetsp:Transcript_26410/g.40694  ORF Transcript_26410/g.40694 Transcript_26410/m.40694 type:complete len:186 (-) Transcript_26410:84-641(-)
MTSKHIEDMNNYKGGPLPPPLIPLSGVALGFGIPYGMKTVLAPVSHSGADGVLHLISHLPVVSALFFAEFVFGAAARSLSTKASFSPAAAAAANEMPVELVESNRICQNHIESLLVFMPIALAASTHDSAVAVTCTMAWVACRFIYRIGYTNRKMPFWRICGVTASITQAMLCGGAIMGWKVLSC